MRIVILGTGALGCVFAARLAVVTEVWMLGAWTEGIAAVRRDGVCLRERDGTRRCVAVNATNNPSEVPPADVAVLLVKSYQTERAAAWARQVLAAKGLAVTLQNGLDNGAKLAAAVGSERAAVGVTYNAAILLGPGDARQTAYLPTVIGVTPSTAQAADRLVELMGAAGLKADTAEGIEALLWGKALANAAINPLTAIWRAPNGGLLETPGRRELLTAMVQEVAAVARAQGIALPYEDPVAFVEGVCRATAVNRSSMLQDVERGRPTEIDSINGVIVAEGRRLGVPTPVNEAVWRVVRGFN